MNYPIALLIGLLGTSVIHASKGIMKLGILRIRAAGVEGRSKRRASLLYGAGIAANFTAPFWVMVANLFGPTVLYTSMYGAGLVALLLFSRFILHEHLTRRHVLGAAVIMAGTGVLGYGEIVGASPMLSAAELSPLVILTVGWVVTAVVVAIGSGRRSLSFQEVFFGLAAGGMAALDALLKGVAQHGDSGATFIPSTLAGGLVLAGSFVVAAGVFGMIQWSFVRHCRASIMGVVYDLSYVGLPVLLFAALRPEYGLTPYNILGLVVLAVGMFFVQGASTPSVVAVPMNPVA